MAEHGRIEYGTAAGNDYAEHEATYLNVMKLAKVGTVSVLIGVVALAIHGTVDSVFWAGLGLFLAAVTTIVGLARNTIVPSVAVLAFMLLVWALLV